MKKYDIITLGGATEDITVYTSEGVIIDNPQDILRQKLLAFEFGAKLKVDRAHITFGGGAANAAVCLAELGFRSAALVAIGDDDRGRRIRENFQKRNVITELVETYPGDTGFSFVLVGPGNEHVLLSNRAANNLLTVGAKETAALAGSEWLYVTSLSGKWREALSGIFKAKDVKVAWNPGHIQLHEGIETIGRYLKKAAVVIVNKDEAIELVVSDLKYRGQSHEFLNDVKNLLTIIKGWGPGIVIVTSGPDGADAYDGREFYRQPAIKEKKRIDTTGVGDAFGSSFVAGLMLYQGDIAKAMYLASRNTASVIGEQGAQNGLLKKKDLRDLETQFSVSNKE